MNSEHNPVAEEEGPGVLKPAGRQDPKEKELLEAIRADLAADAPRLAYAEWLKRRKDPRGEFIEVDCLRHRLDPRDPGRAALDARRNALLERHGREWLKPLLKMGFEPYVRGRFAPGLWYSRGFIEELTISKYSTPEVLPGKAERLFLVAPLLHRLVLHGGFDVPAIAALPQMSLVTSLEFDSIDLKALEAIAGARHLDNLKELKLTVTLEPKAAQVFANSPVIARLHSLHLYNSRQGIKGARILTSTPVFANLENLNLSSTSLDVPTLKVLLESPHLSRLKALCLAYCELKDEAVAVVGAAPTLRGLTHLNLEGCPIGPESFSALVSSANLRNLESLGLVSRLFLPATAAKALAAWKPMRPLKRLSLANVTFDLEAARAFAQAPVFQNLTYLRLQRCMIDPQGFQEMVESASFRELRELDLSYSEIDESGARALAGSSQLSNLTRLALCLGDVGEDGVIVLKHKFAEDVLCIHDDSPDEDDDEDDEDELEQAKENDEKAGTHISCAGEVLRRFEYSEGTSNKFWEISGSETDVTVRFGRIGTEGQTQVKTFRDEAGARKHMEKLIGEKTKKGYREIATTVAPQMAPVPPREEQVIDVEAVWQEIEATVRELNPDESRVLPAGAPPEDFEALEKAIDVVFPGSFKQCYLLHNGSNLITVCPNAFFLPLVAKEGWNILESWRHRLEVAEAHKDEDLPYPEGPIRRAHWHPKWVPFSYDEQGNYTCLDFAPKKEGTVGQVIYVSRDYGPERVLADTFALWFGRLPRELRAWHGKVQEESRR